MHTIEFQAERLISSEWGEYVIKKKTNMNNFFVLPVIIDQSDLRFRWKSIDIGNTLS